MKTMMLDKTHNLMTTNLKTVDNIFNKGREGWLNQQCVSNGIVTPEQATSLGNAL